VSTGDEVVASELHRAQVNVIPALFSGKASNHQPDCDPAPAPALGGPPPALVASRGA